MVPPSQRGSVPAIVTPRAHGGNPRGPFEDAASTVIEPRDRDDAARAGFDDRAFYDLLRRDRADWPMPVVERRIAGAEAPIEAWLAFAARVEY